MAKDHYVPRFLLRNFQIPGRRGWVWSYRRNLSPRPMAIKTIAQEEDYYDIKSVVPGVDKDEVDRLLAFSENAAAPIVTRLLNATSSSLSREEHDNLVGFVGLLATRTPAMRETLASVQVGLHN